VAPKNPSRPAAPRGRAPALGSSSSDPIAERAALEAGARALGVSLDGTQVDRLVRFADLLDKWGRVHNVTAVRGAASVRVRHLLDSLAAVPPLQRFAAVAQIDGTLDVLDVGSGAGLPGLVVALAMPDARVTCVDAAAKKVAFVRQAAAELGVAGLRAEHARVEALRGRRYDVVMSRAFSSLAGFVELTRPLLAAAGVWMAMKGQRPDDEIAALPEDVEVFHVEQLHVPGLDAQRCLVWMRPRQAPA
jgi:16S rRNA (guanine527-N7)-methyltransferase